MRVLRQHFCSIPPPFVTVVPATSTYHFTTILLILFPAYVMGIHTTVTILHLELRYRFTFLWPDTIHLFLKCSTGLTTITTPFTRPTILPLFRLLFFYWCISISFLGILLFHHSVCSVCSVHSWDSGSTFVHSIPTIPFLPFHSAVPFYTISTYFLLRLPFLGATGLSHFCSFILFSSLQRNFAHHTDVYTPHSTTRFYHSSIHYHRPLPFCLSISHWNPTMLVPLRNHTRVPFWDYRLLRLDHLHLHFYRLQHVSLLRCLISTVTCTFYLTTLRLLPYLPIRIPQKASPRPTAYSNYRAPYLFWWRDPTVLPLHHSRTHFTALRYDLHLYTTVTTTGMRLFWRNICFYIDYRSLFGTFHSPFYHSPLGRWRACFYSVPTIRCPLFPEFITFLRLHLFVWFLGAFPARFAGKKRVATTVGVYTTIHRTIPVCVISWFHHFEPVNLTTTGDTDSTTADTLWIPIHTFHFVLCSRIFYSFPLRFSFPVTFYRSHSTTVHLFGTDTIHILITDIPPTVYITVRHILLLSWPTHSWKNFTRVPFLFLPFFGRATLSLLVTADRVSTCWNTAVLPPPATAIYHHHVPAHLEFCFTVPYKFGVPVFTGDACLALLLRFAVVSTYCSTICSLPTVTILFTWDHLTSTTWNTPELFYHLGVCCGVSYRFFLFPAFPTIRTFSRYIP